jgi:hypothetical protein
MPVLLAVVVLEVLDTSPLKVLLLPLTPLQSVVVVQRKLRAVYLNLAHLDRLTVVVAVATVIRLRPLAVTVVLAAVVVETSQQPKQEERRPRRRVETVDLVVKVEPHRLEQAVAVLR